MRGQAGTKAGRPIQPQLEAGGWAPGSAFCKVDQLQAVPLLSHACLCPRTAVAAEALALQAGVAQVCGQVLEVRRRCRRHRGRQRLVVLQKVQVCAGGAIGGMGRGEAKQS